MEFSIKHQKKKYECELEVAAGGYSIAGVSPYSKVDIVADISKKDRSIEWSAVWSENLKYEAFHVGFKNVFDNVSKAEGTRKYPFLQEANALLAWDSPYGLIWSQIACFSGSYALHGQHVFDKSLKAVAQVHFNKNKDVIKPNVLLGLPINLRLAFEKKFDNKVKATTCFRCTDSLTAREVLEMPLNKSLTMKMKYDVNISDIANGNAKGSIKVPSFEFGLKL